MVSGATSPDGVSRSYSYDNDGFLTEISETIESGETNKVNFVYDNYGRVSTKTYTNADNNSYTITNVYNNYGYLDQVKFDNTTVWDLTNMNERGQITQASLQGTPCTWSYGTDGILDEVDAGSVHNYEYDFNVNTGNLNYRKNVLKTLREDFDYDNLDRLDDIDGPLNDMILTYNNNGNIDSKGDVGDFEYNIANRPFQVSDIDNYTSIVDTTQQDIDYTSFSKIETITQAAYEATFKYNSDNQRVKMVLKNNGSVTKTKYYFESSYEKVVEGSTTTEYIWIGGSPYDAVAVAKITNGGTPEIYSIYRDHLGTMTHIKSNSTTNKNCFDACSVKLSFCELCETKALVELIPISEAVREGRRRDADSWSFTLNDEPDLFADRGFTGHEHMPEFGLINMNGRVYDPVLGRFLSPDNYVQAPGYSQGFNRYSYCWNNPLKYTDPSGEKFMDWFKYTNAWFIFVDAMQWINDKTPNLRSKMVEAGIPSFNAGMTIGSNESFDFNYSINGNQIYDSQENDVTQAVNNFENDFDNVQMTLAGLGTSSDNRRVDRYNWKNASGSKKELDIYDYSNLALNAVNAIAFAGEDGLISGSISYLKTVRGASKEVSLLGNVGRTLTRVGVGTSVTSGVLSIYKYSMIEKPTWGNKAELGVGLTSATLSVIPQTTYLGIGLGLMDVSGGFNGFYSYMNMNEFMFKQHRTLILPGSNGTIVPISF